MKKCFKCEKEKELSEFYPHSRMKDGHLNKCKDCTKKDTAERVARLMQDLVWAEKELARCREKTRRRWRAGFRPSQRKPREYDPVKRHAHAVVHYALRKGRLIRLSCQVCGARKSHAHHTDYGKPLEVVWLCSIHHGEQHWKKAA